MRNALSAVAALAGAWLWTGCAVPNEFADVDHPGQPGVHAYHLAKAEWAVCRATPQTPASRQAHLQGILQHLDTALTQDPGVALFWQCRGRALLELGQIDEARHCFAKAIQRCIEWTPGWLALVTVHLHQQNVPAAAEAVEAAWTTIENLRAGGTPPDVMLLGIPLVTTRQPGVRDDQVDPRTGQARLLAQVHEAVQWDGQPGRLAASGVLDVLRGYTNLGEFLLVRHQAPGDHAAQERWLLAAQRVAPDLWEARCWRAWLCWDRRDYDRAEELLRAYYFQEVAPGQAEALIRTVYLRTCTDAFLDRGDSEWRQRAELAFARLREQSATYDPVHDVVLAAAEQLFLADERRPTALAALTGWAPELPRDRRIRGQLLAALGSPDPAVVELPAPPAVGGGQ
ncbi:MAG: tetratricopeptide repeat protein [Planctomycetes bacterium]|nr:tetratricopeptide repeat protein [Planctomycetota bacterium]